MVTILVVHYTIKATALQCDAKLHGDLRGLYFLTTITRNAGNNLKISLQNTQQCAMDTWDKYR